MEKQRKWMGWVLFVIGILMIGFFSTADVLGIGKPGFGYKQITGCVVGALSVGAGIVLVRKKRGPY